MSLDIKNELSKLIDINEDACEFYESAQEKTDNPQFKSTFRELEQLHKNVIGNMQQHIIDSEGPIEPDQTFTGQTQKFWGELMSSISNDVNETLVTHLEEAEDRCLHSIQDAIEKDDMPTDTVVMLQKEMITLKKTHDYMKDLKDTLKAA